MNAYADADLRQLFADLVLFTHGDVDRHGECHIVCPDCGRESSPRSPHCSFCVDGFYCFVCGAKYSLAGLAKRLGYQTGDYHAPKPRAVRQEAPRKAYSWQAYADDLIRKYESHSQRYAIWGQYTPLTRSTIERMRLGVGVLPSSRCHHERLIVPVIHDGIVLGLRGRQFCCDCGKWLAAGGWSLDVVPLYNAGALQKGCVVWIVENPVDALMLTERTPFVGVATYSVSYWRPHWTELLRAVRPEYIIVAYDNDLPGNGGDERREEFVRDWLRTHPRVPDPAGPRLANALQRDGLPAHLYRWGRAENKTDVGSLLAAGGQYERCDATVP